MESRDSPAPWLRNAGLEDALGHGLSESEFKNIQSRLGRELNILELGICSALYSEHCSYKSTKVHLKTLPTSGPRVIQGPGENAGVVDIGDGQAVVFKVESHNHPSFIEPYQGAATGVGGILRDVFTMGARPLALLNSLRFGSKKNPRTSYLLRRAVAGIGGYGNCMGIPTIGGELFFHESYDGNCLVNAFALGLVDADKIFLGQASGVGNSIFYVGSKTGRDGIHGATMASESFDDDSEAKRPTVQVGDPFQEKLLLEACLEIMRTGFVVGIQDMGAAGMTSSTYEMADRAGTGVEIHLDRVPQRESGMNPYEIMLSESQERMLLVVKKGHESAVREIFERWELDAVQIGEVVPGREVKLFWHGQCVSEMPVDAVTSGVPEYRWPIAEPADFKERTADIPKPAEPRDLSAVWLKMIGSENLCARIPVYRQYDSTVRTNTVIHPGSDAGLIRIKSEGIEKGVAVKLDCNSRYCGIDPKLGAALSLAESCRNVSAVGALPIGASDCLNFGSPEEPEGMWQIAKAIEGLGEACRAMDVPIVSGNVSLYNETKGERILPTPTLAVVGLISDASKAKDCQFKEIGDLVFVIGRTDPLEIGGSEYLAQIHGLERGRLPCLDYALELKTNAAVRALAAEDLIKSCHDISAGGLAAALAECCLGQYRSIGARIEPEKPLLGSRAGLIFAETGARFIISAAPALEAQVRAKLGELGITIEYSGLVGGYSIRIADWAEINLDQANKVWLNGLAELMG